MDVVVFSGSSSYLHVAMETMDAAAALAAYSAAMDAMVAQMVVNALLF